MKLILVVSVALAAPGLLGSDDIFKSFDDVEQGFDNNFASDFGGAFGASPFLKGGLLDRGAAPRSARTDNQPSQKGSAFFLQLGRYCTLCCTCSTDFSLQNLLRLQRSA